MQHNGKEMREFLMCCNYLIKSNDEPLIFICQECGYILENWK